MKKLFVNTGKPYSILIESGLLRDSGRLIRSVTEAQKAVIVTDSNIDKLYTQTVADSLINSGFEVCIYTFSAGESSKSISTVNEMLRFTAKMKLTRKDIIIALGGGVTGDMAGFAASIYMRGINFVQIPTSLLAQIDSSVGGKTGVDLPEGKNLCGTFWQPILVIVDPNVLGTLPERYFADGLGEAVKYGCIKSRSLFERLEKEDANEFLEDLICECVDIKRDIVEKDEREKGERKLLNFGHTFGHALEKYYDYKTLSHGEAVGIGMVLATKASEMNGITEKGTADRIINLLKKLNLPFSDKAPMGDLLLAASNDKKSNGSGIDFIFLKSIGESFIYPIENKKINEFFSAEDKKR